MHLYETEKIFAFLTLLREIQESNGVTKLSQQSQMNSLHCRVCSKISVSENNNGSFITLNMAYTLETCANKKINCVFF